MSNIIVEFIEDIPELILFWFPLIVLLIISTVWVICILSYYKYEEQFKEKGIGFWKYAYYFWYELIIPDFGKKPKKNVKNTE